MHIAIVEDNKDEQLKLQKYITDYCSKEQMSIEVSGYDDGIEIIDHYSGNYDLIYFDIEMPIMDGMTAAKKVRNFDKNVTIVFLTNYIQFAIDGYSVEAADFLLKPITYFNFEEHFKKILTKIKHTSQPNYMLKTNSGFRKILLDDLFYIESEGHYLHFYSQSGTYTILESMKKVEEQLEENGFFRCNNGYLVNLKHVKNLEGNVATVGPYKLQVSRPRKKGFLTALTNYLESKE